MYSPKSLNIWSQVLFKKLFKRFYLLLERGREGEKRQCVVASSAPPTGDLAHNPGMYPDWESNRRPFGSQASTQSTEPPQPGPKPLKMRFCLVKCQ